MKIKFDNPVSPLTKITKDQAKILIVGHLDGDTTRYFGKPISGLVKIDYPLTNPDFVQVHNIETVGELLWEIANRYMEIYKEEHETLSAVNSNVAILNRGKSNGIHGIYGHDIGDLVIEGIEIEGIEIEGEEITLSVGS